MQSRRKIFKIFFSPPSSYKYFVKALHSDIDGNGHVNQAVFIKWCCDAATDAALNGAFQDFKHNMKAYNVEKVEVKYVREGLANEEYVVETWQDEKLLRTAADFVISRRDSTVVFMGRFTYNSALQASNL